MFNYLRWHYENASLLRSSPQHRCQRGIVRFRQNWTPVWTETYRNADRIPELFWRPTYVNVEWCFSKCQFDSVQMLHTEFSSTLDCWKVESRLNIIIEVSLDQEKDMLVSEYCEPKKIRIRKILLTLGNCVKLGSWGGGVQPRPPTVVYK